MSMLDRVNIFSKQKDISKALASKVAEVAEQAATSRGRFTVALSGARFWTFSAPS
ncbi:MAG: hypothetical protein U5L00_03020 [Desulfovermiculus sp.]|nr:hypothetical protein [Desulfovermiculus sp.]